MSDILDLDALVPPTATIKFGGNEVVVQPPKTADVLALGSLGQKLQDVSALPEAELEKLVADMTGLLQKIIPELAGKELNTQQLLKLMELVSEMAVPPDAKELEKRGITPVGNSDPKDK